MLQYGLRPDSLRTVLIPCGARDLIGNMHDPDLREELLHPRGAQITRNWFSLQSADKNGEVVCVVPGELYEVLVSCMRRHESSNDHSALARAGH